MTDQNRTAPNVEQVADMPGVYRVVAADAGPHREALMHRVGAGWQVSYWFDPSGGVAQRRALLGDMSQDEAAAYAVELVAAAELSVPLYESLLIAAIGTHPVVVDVVRAHRPYRDPVDGLICLGDEGDEPSRVDHVTWVCRTASLLAKALHVSVPPQRGL